MIEIDLGRKLVYMPDLNNIVVLGATVPILSGSATMPSFLLPPLQHYFVLFRIQHRRG
jgi:hypothetical protein